MNAIIILNYNDSETTVSMVNRIKDFNEIDKIILVDNSSTDESYKILSGYSSDRVDVICTPNNNGYAYGNNYGIKYAIEKYKVRNFIVSNPDIIIDDTGVADLFEFLETEPNIGMVTGVIHNSFGKVVNNYAWKLPGFKDLLINSSLILAKIVYILNIGHIYNKSMISKQLLPLRVDVVPGCFFAMNSKTIRNVGYFDERTFLYNEENILAHKIKRSNYENYILPKVRIIHLENSTIKKTYKSVIERRRISYDSSLIYIKEYLKISKCLIKVYSIIYRILGIENLLIYKIKNVKDIYLKRRLLNTMEEI